MRIAMTGATGFVGAATLERALAQGMRVDALTRRPQAPREGIRWIAGALDDPASLDRLVREADAVIHIAGVVNAPDRARFEAGNALGTMFLVDAMRRATVRRLVHVSSLAAREPDLSDYGWSKELAERHVQASGLDWTIVRPGGIYGPGDRDMLDLFRVAARGVMPLPPGGRLSVIEVGDLARLLVTLPQHRLGAIAQLYEVDDGTPDGWSHIAFARAIGLAVGRRTVRTFAMPAWLLRGGAKLDGLVRGKRAKLTADRVRYFCHDDWVVDPAKQVPATIWQPMIATQLGLAETAAAYRAKGWL
ncbi:NAD-dependent epimerase/dehydratase family protein [soil metagenome]